MPESAEIEFGDDPTAVYRLYDAEENLLYVGMTSHPKARMVAHAASQPWWDQVCRRTMVWYDTRPEASRAENDAMSAENPRYNQRASFPFDGVGAGLPREVPLLIQSGETVLNVPPGVGVKFVYPLNPPGTGNSVGGALFREKTVIKAEHPLLMARMTADPAA